MTPRQIKEQLYQAASERNAQLALAAAVAFAKQGLWTSTPHYDPIEPDGSEVALIARRPGTCCLCHLEFKAGTPIRWRSRVDCHQDCWNDKFSAAPESPDGRYQS